MNNKQFRQFVFTWNNYEKTADWQQVLHKSLEELGANYYIYGYEIGEETHTPHLQGYVQLSKRKTFSMIKKALPKVHFENALGNHEDNVTYCKKSGEYTEKGDLRTVARGRAKQANDWAAIIDKAAKNNLEEIRDENPREYIIYYRTFKSIAIDNIISEAKDRRGLWIYGQPGTGKSRAAHQLFPNAYWKNGNKWWDGYQGEQTVVLDDLDTPALYSYIKRWADRYKVLGEVKGSAVSLAYEQFVITSNFHPWALGNQDEKINRVTIEAIQRRFLVVSAVGWSEELQDLLVQYPDSRGLITSGQPPVQLRSALVEAGWDLNSENNKKQPDLSQTVDLKDVT